MIRSSIIKNSLKAFLLCFSGSLLFVLIITAFPLFGSLFLTDFPLKRVIYENFSLMIPLSLMCVLISPIYGFFSSNLRHNRLKWLMFIGVSSYWTAVIFVILFMSEFSILNEKFSHVFIISIWGIAAFSILALPILIPVIFLLEKWTRTNKTMAEETIRTIADNKKVN